LADIDDTATGAGWTLDPLARHAMLLEASREALANGDFSDAVALAEELLDEEPDDPDALLLVAEAAPRYGHAEVGVLAASQASRRGIDVGALEAAALLAACQVDRALEAAESLLARAPEHARAHAVRGRALDLLGRTADAEAALARATALRPDHYPPPLSLDPDGWDPVLLEALSGLDPEIRDALRRVEIDLTDLPDLTLLRTIRPPPSPLVDALLQETEGERARILLFRRNLLRGASNATELTERIRDALKVEAELLLEEDG
jgi:tetratricopeptide (TPR) repeat protein